jgi:hypothetical protein
MIASFSELEAFSPHRNLVGAVLGGIFFVLGWDQPRRGLAVQRKASPQDYAASGLERLPASPSQRAWREQIAVNRRTRINHWSQGSRVRPIGPSAASRLENSRIKKSEQ